MSLNHDQILKESVSNHYNYPKEVISDVSKKNGHIFKIHKKSLILKTWH